MTEKLNRQQICAAITRGCQTAPFVMEDVTEDAFYTVLRLNGWHLNYGKWVCAKHPVKEEPKQ